jgi:hypothetical protein
LSNRSQFTFSVDYSAIAGRVGARLQFCVKYACAGHEYWDSNGGKNYVFQCFGPPTHGKPPGSGSGSGWGKTGSDTLAHSINAK